MKKYYLAIIGICFCVALLSAVRQAGATQFVNENWDSGTPSAGWPCQTTNNVTWDGWTSNAANAIPQAGVSTTAAYSGTRSFHQFRPSGSTTACDISHDISPSPTTLYLKFNLYMTPNWSGTWTDNASFMHWIFTNSAMSNTGFRLDMVTDHEWGGCPHGQVCILPEGDGGSLWWNTPWGNGLNNNGSPGINLKSIIGTWTCFEYKMQISGSNVILTESINGTVTRGPITGPGQNGSTFTKVILSGWENSGASHDADWYMDDIVMSDTGPIGCGASHVTSSAPAPPVIQ